MQRGRRHKPGRAQLPSAGSQEGGPTITFDEVPLITFRDSHADGRGSDEAKHLDQLDAELPEGARSPIDGRDQLDRTDLISEHSFANKLFIQQKDDLAADGAES